MDLISAGRLWYRWRMIDGFQSVWTLYLPNDQKSIQSVCTRSFSFGYEWLKYTLTLISIQLRNPISPYSVMGMLCMGDVRWTSSRVSRDSVLPILPLDVFAIRSPLLVRENAADPFSPRSQLARHQPIPIQTLLECISYRRNLLS